MTTEHKSQSEPDWTESVGPVEMYVPPKQHSVQEAREYLGMNVTGYIDERPEDYVDALLYDLVEQLEAANERIARFERILAQPSSKWHDLLIAPYPAKRRLTPEAEEQWRAMVDPYLEPAEQNQDSEPK